MFNYISQSSLQWVSLAFMSSWMFHLYTANPAVSWWTVLEQQKSRSSEPVCICILICTFTILINLIQLWNMLTTEISVREVWLLCMRQITLSVTYCTAIGRYNTDVARWSFGWVIMETSLHPLYVLHFISLKKCRYCFDSYCWSVNGDWVDMWSCFQPVSLLQKTLKTGFILRLL